MDLDSNPDVQFYALARFGLHNPDESLSQTRPVLIVDPHYPRTGTSAICPLMEENTYVSITLIGSLYAKNT